jgi:hypothetical protein
MTRIFIPAGSGGGAAPFAGGLLGAAPLDAAGASDGAALAAAAVASFAAGAAAASPAGVGSTVDELGLGELAEAHAEAATAVTRSVRQSVRIGSLV